MSHEMTPELSALMLAVSAQSRPFRTRGLRGLHLLSHESLPPCQSMEDFINLVLSLPAAFAQVLYVHTSNPDVFDDKEVPSFGLPVDLAGVCGALIEHSVDVYSTPHALVGKDPLGHSWRIGGLEPDEMLIVSRIVNPRFTGCVLCGMKGCDSKHKEKKLRRLRKQLSGWVKAHLPPEEN